MVDFSSHLDIQEPTYIRTIMTCYVRLDKKSMVSALAADQIFINGKYYKVPETTLLECLINKRFGEIKLELEEIN